MPKGKHYRITLADVLAAHDEALEYGGRPGIIDLSLIESAIGRPYTGYKKAAALTQSLCGNHGFADGTKRTALLVVELFLDRSGYELENVTNTEIADTFVAVVTRQMDFDSLERWYKERIRPVQGGP